MKAFANQYRDELLNNIIPFWETKSIDEKNGGFFTCLNRTGSVYDTDKFMWLQGRQVWTFSMLYDKVAANENWKTIAIHGAEFMKKYGRDAEGNWYFSLTADGKPLVQPYNIFSDCFAAMGFGALYKITDDEGYKQIALDTFNNILKRQHNWKGSYNKGFPGTRPLKNFSLPMILCNLSLELEHILGNEKLEALAKGVMQEVMEVFYHPEFGHVLENVAPDGNFVDCFEGRLLNPGHAIESMWFIIDLAHRFNQPDIMEKAKNIMLQTIEHGWDEKYGGLFYFLDVKGNPPQQLEWDQKLWWVHIETLVGLAKAWKHTGDEKCAAWFEKIHAYTWHHFKDPEYGEWFGYLNRQGEVLLPLKGGKWKGCFHIPRGLYQVWKTLE
jgi:N-acylglucosamine 2-epimerase